ncbi:MAG: 23S rRNA (adenine(2503)-C(2))-methyltransferase RlmN [Spirochaetaceae bacterium]|jgi:23S rRNA (adenine2503-C2)-methyltransferase|nr:23S rRNA (adenine(2503)-C(2))-methyltransferase RlmN [Spirochaetaceae bacterium]
MTALSGYTPDELEKALPVLLGREIPGYRSRQITAWLARGVSSFDGMKNLPLSLREELALRAELYTTRDPEVLEDPDGTVKLTVRLHDGAKIEAVLLKDRAGRKTACLSSQAGCPMGCVFCKTGKLGYRRNLSAAEIVEQFLRLKCRDSGLSNIVVMGMGEPLLNLEALKKAVAVIEHPEGLNFSRRRITLSSCGIIAGIEELAGKGPLLELAVSITSADDGLRSRLMPVNRTNPLDRLKKALLEYQKTVKRRITLEAVLLRGLNTGKPDAAALAAFARGLDAVVNLIPWNPVPGLLFEGKELEEPSDGEVRRFALELEERGLRVTLRYRRGRGVLGACGQLGALE